MDHVPPWVVSWLAGNGPQRSFHNLEIAGINFPITVHIADQGGLGVRIKICGAALPGEVGVLGTQLAVPVGTYVQGVIDKVTKGGRVGPSLKMHFTQLLYANGYSVDMEGASVQGEAHRPNPCSAATAATATPSASYNSLAAPSSPQTPTLQAPTPHTGAIVGAAIAGVAATAALLILSHYHRGGSIVLFDTGWQFEMVLESPLSVDAASVAAAAAAVTSDK